MASFGAKLPCFCEADADAGEGVSLGKLVSANLTVTTASGELWADDTIAEYESCFASGSIAMETDDITDASAAVVYGATVDSTDGLVFKNTDECPEGVLGYYKCLMVGGVKKYRACVYPRVKASIGNDNAQTKGSSITFNTASTTFQVMPNSTGVWRKTKDFTDEADAVSFVKTACKVSNT